MKKCTYDTVRLLALIDEYGFCRSMAAMETALGAEDAESYKERTSITFKKILAEIKELEERGI